MLLIEALEEEAPDVDFQSLPSEGSDCFEVRREKAQVARVYRAAFNLCPQRALIASR